MKKERPIILFCALFLVFSLTIHRAAFEACAQSSDRLIKEGIAMMEKGTLPQPEIGSKPRSE
jgi:hypothetical protein